MAKEAKITKAQAKRALDALFDGVTTNLKKGKRVSFVGFGTFNVTKRKARTGRNPQTGDEIKIPAAKVPKFKPGKGLKDALN
ncbi:MAG: DNA-binding protein HU [candidate division Zixibacteria bacterium]|nr:DNA-binding protein HU [candidate division Zixibacteria bacterium]